MKKFNFQPVVIIGAPRSGTNILRDVICKFDTVGTWPCDEINYIWRHGNLKEESDELDRELATLKVKQFVRNEFVQFANKENLNFLVEKTCANSLRVPFVDEIVPEAKYIYIVRDGVDAVGSATIRWKAALDIPYIMKKVRYVPMSDLPYYALRYLSNRIFKLLSREKRLSFWGPKFSSLDETLDNHSLEEVCALQWKSCVDLSEKAFSSMPDNKYIRVNYEVFVKNPFNEVSRILQTLGVPFSDKQVKEAVSTVSSRSVGKGRLALGGPQINTVTSLISDSLKRYGYK